MTATKERIICEALRLFARRGYEAVSVRDIGAAVGLTQAALYKHFASKRDIFDKIVAHMELDDFQRAHEYAVPDATAAQGEELYKSVSAEQLFAFTRAQFEYWTENSFAACFRRLLTLEQYSSEENSQRYQQYFGSGVISYTADIFRNMSCLSPALRADADALAVEFYAPVQFLMGQFDCAEDKEKIRQLLNEHLNRMKKITE